jgi:hypothetical protein
MVTPPLAYVGLLFFFCMICGFCSGYWVNLSKVLLGLGHSFASMEGGWVNCTKQGGSLPKILH